MHHRSKRGLGALLALMLALTAVGLALAAQGPKPKTYTVDLDALDDSGVTGTVNLFLDGDQLTVRVEASGLEPNKLHPQHIHGHLHPNRNATCPPPEADTDGDGVISLEEGLPYYGPVLLGLAPFPTADANGNVEFKATYTVDPKVLGPLQKRAVVLHGLTVNGTYVPSLPVACGQIRVDPNQE